MKISKVYCDMDGVIVDLEKQVKKYFKGYDGSHLSSKDFFKISSSVKNFWLDAEWTIDGKELMRGVFDLCNKHNVELWILSAPPKIASLDPRCKPEKKKWIWKNMPDIILKNRVIIEYDKSAYAKPDCVLIDDLKKNIDSWEQKGGVGILHTDAESSIKQLKKILDS